MSDVITLSDDDEEQVLDDGPTTTATVHVREGKALNLASLGISPNQSGYTVKNSSSGITPGYTVKRKRALPLGVQNEAPSTKVKSFAYVKKFMTKTGGTITNIRQLPIKEALVEDIDAALENILSKYTFEATAEGSQPQRRSTRFANRKRIEGKFICTYNPKVCVKVIDDVGNFINHIWSHVAYDCPEINIPATKPKKMSTSVALNSLIIAQDNSCPLCQRRFTSPYLKALHFNNCHLIDKKSETCCNVCEQDFSDNGAFKNHIYYVHKDNHAPYNCRQCRYKTSVRSFLFNHYLEKHTQESLLCPICLWQFDLPTSVRTKKYINAVEYIKHMKKHTEPNKKYRCGMCVLLFSDFEEFSIHKVRDHQPVPNGWNIIVKKSSKISPKFKISTNAKISELQKKFFETKEGKRIDDEVACSSSVERLGYDTTSSGDVLYQCGCGEWSSYNGNRAASHFHRCRSNIVDINRGPKEKTGSKDDEKEIQLFAVFPGFSQDEINRMNKTKKKDPLLNDELYLFDENFGPDVSDLPYLRVCSSRYKDSLNSRIDNLLMSHRD